MTNIENVRCVLLSSPYADADEPEIRQCFPNGPKRTVGMVEVVLDDGSVGLGEGYLAVFAPLVFRSLVDLFRPYVEGRDGFDIDHRTRDLRGVSDYWSLQGAARHVISAFEAALHDAKAKSMGVPVHALLGGAKTEAIKIYGSGGNCASTEKFEEEFDQLQLLGIDIYKIRARKNEIRRAAWAIRAGARRGVRVAVDMCQNLADPPQDVADVVAFVEQVHALSGEQIFFLEEAIGPDSPEGFRELRTRIEVPVCGGEIITTPKEMIDRIHGGVYDFVQPDASVIGGIGPVMEVFGAAAAADMPVVVHAWGGAAAKMANYHAAFAGGGELVEFPMLDFPLGNDMLGDQATIRDGYLQKPTAPGLGLTLTADMETRYPFDESAVYTCLMNASDAPADSTWIIEDT